MADPRARGSWDQFDELAQAAGRTSWSAWIAELEADKGRKVCGARNRKRAPCAHAAGYGTDHDGAGRCKYHGGASIAGAEHYRYEHGQRSKYRVGGTLGDLYRAVAGDLVDLNDEGRLLDARIAQLVGALDQNPVTIRDLEDVVRDVRGSIQQVLNGGDPQAFVAALRRLDRALSSAGAESRVWREIQSLMTTKVKLARLEVLRRAKEHEPPTWVDILALVDDMRRAILEVVPANLRPAVHGRFAKMIPPGMQLPFGGASHAADA